MSARPYARRLGAAADEIMVIDSGRIAEHGARQILAETPGSRYAGLLAASLATLLLRQGDAVGLILLSGSR